MNIRHHRKIARICVVAATVALAGAGGCRSDAGSAESKGSDPVATTTNLVGTTWLAEDIRGRGVVDIAQPTLTFETAEAVNGNGGCNRFFGPVKIDGERIAFGPLGATQMGCPSAIADQEERYFAALGDARGFRLDEGGLLFLTAEPSDPPILRFNRRR